MIKKIHHDYHDLHVMSRVSLNEQNANMCMKYCGNQFLRHKWIIKLGKEDSSVTLKY